MKRERRLGRGLAGLLGGDDDVDVVDPPESTDDTTDPAAGMEELVRPGARRAPSSHATPSDVVLPPAGTMGLPHANRTEARVKTRTKPGLQSSPGLESPTTTADRRGSASIGPVATHGQSDVTPGAPVGSGDTAAAGRDLLLSINLIEENPFQPRREFLEVEIASLAESLKDHDMLQPVLVRRMGTRYQLISGERRLRAARLAGWKKIPARIREADDRLVAELAIVENLQRKDLSSIEKALSFQRYLDEHACRQEDLAKRLKIDRSTIANLLRLLELPPEIRRELQAGSITAGHARALLPLADRRKQIKVCNLIKIEGLSVRATEQMVAESVGRDGSRNRSGNNGKKTAGKTSTTQRQIASLETELRRALGTKVEIKSNAKGSGKILIHFKNHSEFERIRDVLSG